jgi:hypothetical protein
LKETIMFTPRSGMLSLFAACGLFLLSATPALGDDGKVAGRVTFEGKPLPAGKITFHFDNGQFVGSRIKDAKYAVDRVPVGTWKVTIEGAGVPVKYSSEATTPLKVEVMKGMSVLDFVLAR